MLGRDPGRLLLVVPEARGAHRCFEFLLPGRQLNGVKGTHEPSRAGLRAPRADAREVGSPGRPRVDGSCAWNRGDTQETGGSLSPRPCQHIPDDRADTEPREADGEPGGDIADEVDVEEDATRSDRDRNETGCHEPRRSPRARTCPLREKQSRARRRGRPRSPRGRSETNTSAAAGSRSRPPGEPARRSPSATATSTVTPRTARPTKAASPRRPLRTRRATARPATTAVPSSPPSHVKIRASHSTAGGTVSATQRETSSSTATT